MLGVHCLRKGISAVYDVTDDWRTARLSNRDRARVVAAEDTLARTVRTVVCSEVLRDRWVDRYGVTPAVIHNGVDTQAHAQATAHTLDGSAPHLMYVGTLHEDRLEIDLLIELAERGRGVVHLVGPDHLGLSARRQLESTKGIRFHGAVPYDQVPGLMASADVLICPHRVTEFTMSLDAIKSFEYLASGRPVVATPTSGFQAMVEPGLRVVDRSGFVDAVAQTVQQPATASAGRTHGHDWSDRARAFAEQLLTLRRAALASFAERGMRRVRRELALLLARLRWPSVEFGPRCDVRRGLTITLLEGGQVSFGAECILDRQLTVESGGVLSVGPRTIFGHHCTLGAKESIRIGADCLVAEMVSIRDSDHGTDSAGVPYRKQGHVTAPVVIGDNVWLGSRVVVTRGVCIGDNAVIGAGAVVTRDVPPNSLAVGVPARVVRSVGGEHRPEPRG